MGHKVCRSPLHTPTAVPVSPPGRLPSSRDFPVASSGTQALQQRVGFRLGRLAVSRQVSPFLSPGSGQTGLSHETFGFRASAVIPSAGVIPSAVCESGGCVFTARGDLLFLLILTSTQLKTKQTAALGDRVKKQTQLMAQQRPVLRDFDSVNRYAHRGQPGEVTSLLSLQLSLGLQ